MGVTLDPYLNFKGNAREAMEFYEGVFGGKLTISTFAEFHASTDPSEDDLVMHADLHGPEGIRFMAADTRTGWNTSQGRTSRCRSVARTRRRSAGTSTSSPMGT